MKYCVSRKNKYRWDAQEVVYPANMLNEVIIAATEHPNIDFIIQLDSFSNDKNPNCEQLAKQQGVYKNIIVSFKEIEDLSAYAKTNGAGRRMYKHPVSSWNLINLLHALGCESILITEPLIFKKDQLVKHIIEERGMKIRINPTFVRPGIMTEDKDDLEICHSWILPQFINLYEDFIDVFDLSDCGGEMRENTLFEIYANVGEYQQSMRHLFMNFNENIPAAFADESWVKKRLNCGQVCQISKSRCHYCYMQQEVYKAMNKVRDKKDDSYKSLELKI